MYSCKLSSEIQNIQRLVGMPQIGLCPGVCVGWVDKKGIQEKPLSTSSYSSKVGKPELVKEIEKEMRECAKQEKFEEANKYKRMLYALEHIQDVALIKRDNRASREHRTLSASRHTTLRTCPGGKHSRCHDRSRRRRALLRASTGNSASGV